MLERRLELLHALTEADEDASITLIIQGVDMGSFVMLRTEDLAAGPARAAWDGINDWLESRNEGN
jgi:hypothetical protein